jgi:hypothetical protein
LNNAACYKLEIRVSLFGQITGTKQRHGNIDCYRESLPKAVSQESKTRICSKRFKKPFKALIMSLNNQAADAAVTALNPRSKMNLACIEVPVSKIVLSDKDSIINAEKSPFLLSFFKWFEFYNQPILVRSKSNYAIIHNQVDVELAMKAGVETIQAFLWSQPTVDEQARFYYFNLALRFKSLSHVQRCKEVLVLQGRLYGDLKNIQWDWPSSTNKVINRKLAYILCTSESTIERLKHLHKKAIDDKKKSSFHYLKMIDEGYGINRLEEELGLENKQVKQGQEKDYVQDEAKANATTATPREYVNVKEEGFNDDDVPVETEEGEETEVDFDAYVEDDDDELSDDEHFDDDDYADGEDDVDDTAETANTDSTTKVETENFEGAAVRKLPISPIVQMLLDNATEDEHGNLSLNIRLENFTYKEKVYKLIQNQFIATVEPSYEGSRS